jgi:hypothetical protein
MPKAVLILAAAALALTGTAVSAKSTVEKGEAQLAKILGGRTAGEPMTCISVTVLGRQLKIIDGVGVTYRRGDTIYVSRVDRPENLRWTDRSRFDSTTPGKMCAGDRLWTSDIKTGTPSGSVQLLEFVPYARQG